tara:strand:+ start:438 stop:818 length:381 start_codon:yes stop_codon:yes gene_type:complete
MIQCAQRLFDATEQAVSEYQKENLQPIFQTQKNGHLDELEFNTQHSTTQSIIEDPYNVVSIDNIVMTLLDFNKHLKSLGHTLIYDGNKASASIKDFKLVSLEEAQQILSSPNIPQQLTTRAEHMDA